jgi:hypothetical protein
MPNIFWNEWTTSSVAGLLAAPAKINILFAVG